MAKDLNSDAITPGSAVTPDRALEIVLETTKPLDAVKLILTEVGGYVLAQDITAGNDIPPFDNSAMDGYALLGDDISDARPDRPAALKLIEEQPAGKATEKIVRPGTAVKIMTGAPIPGGADTVVPIEQAKQETETVLILKALPKGRHIRRAGEDMAKGSLVLEAGTLIGPVQIGLLASLGYAEVSVIRKPKIAIIGTGNELVSIDQPLAPGKIRDSNSYALTAQARDCGAPAERLGVARDTKEDVGRLIAAALESADVVATSGGVSVGDYDFVKDVLADLGAELKFWGVKQKPGKPLAFWKLENKLIFGLPGNPVASVVCFEEYVRPALLKMMGRRHLMRPVVKARLAHDLKKKPGRQHFVGVGIASTDHGYEAAVNGRQGSGILTSLAGADGIALIPAEVTELRAGDLVEVQLIKLPEDH